MKRARRYWLLVGWLGALVIPFAGVLLWLDGDAHANARASVPLFRKQYDASGSFGETITDDEWAWHFGGRAGLGELSTLAKDPTISPRGRRVALEVHDYILAGDHLESGREMLTQAGVRSVLQQPATAAYFYYVLVHDSLYPAKRVPLVRYRLLDPHHEFTLIDVTPGETSTARLPAIFVHSEITSTRVTNGDVRFTITAPFNSGSSDRTERFDTDLGVIHITYQADDEVATESSDGRRVLPSTQDELAIRCTFTVTAKELQEPDLVFRMLIGHGQPGGSLTTFYIRLGKFVPK